MLAARLVHTMILLPRRCCYVAVVVQVFELSFYKGVSRTSSLFSVGMDAGRGVDTRFDPCLTLQSTPWFVGFPLQLACEPHTTPAASRHRQHHVGGSTSTLNALYIDDVCLCHFLCWCPQAAGSTST